MTRTKSLPLEDYRKGQEELGNWRVEQLAKLETTPEFQIIARLVEEADSNLMVTVQQFFELTALNRDLGTIGAHCSRTSSALLALSSRTSPEKQAKLISFVVELKKETILNLQTGEPIRYQQDCDFVWTDLPTFGSASSDELHDRWPVADNTAKETQESENLNAFVAQVRAAQIWSGSPLIWPALIFQHAWPDMPTSHTIYFVRVACLWYIYAADAIWAATLDKEDKQWTREIWNTYKEHLLDSQVKTRNQEAKKLLDRAVIQMKKADGSGSE